jgi:hypothetical protein
MEVFDVLSVSVVVVDRGVDFGAERFEAALEDYPVLRELGPTPWAAVNRLVGAHRSLLERRWMPCWQAAMRRLGSCGM